MDGSYGTSGDAMLTLNSNCEALEANEMMSTLNMVVMRLTEHLIDAHCLDTSVGASLM